MVRKVNTKLLSDVKSSRNFLQCPTFFPLVDFIDVLHNGEVQLYRQNLDNNQAEFAIQSCQRSIKARQKIKDVS